MIAAFGIGNSVQSNSVAQVLSIEFGMSKIIVGLIIAVLVASVIFGGIAGSVSRSLKVVVYDLKTLKFDLFKNAKDFKQFVKKNHPEKLELIKSQENKDGRIKSTENIDLIRKIITELNTTNYN